MILFFLPWYYYSATENIILTVILLFLSMILGFNTYCNTLLTILLPVYWILTSTSSVIGLRTSNCIALRVSQIVPACFARLGANKNTFETITALLSFDIFQSGSERLPFKIISTFPSEGRLDCTVTTNSWNIRTVNEDVF